MTLPEVLQAIDQGRWTLDELMTMRDAINLVMRRTKRAQE